MTLIAPRVPLRTGARLLAAFVSLTALPLMCSCKADLTRDRAAQLIQESNWPTGIDDDNVPSVVPVIDASVAQACGHLFNNCQLTTEGFKYFREIRHCVIYRLRSEARVVAVTGISVGERQKIAAFTWQWRSPPEALLPCLTAMDQSAARAREASRAALRPWPAGPSFKALHRANAHFELFDDGWHFQRVEPAN